ncbi:hypothetical protein [Oxynema aestuarii]|uniref:Uncharacterized protein n=1 Tax=Oxynema aestuarii AP17 TaxID=2064643 RepID=A0A6H1U1D7_9CYAN|nr:hypothetical protein [Oxynema aestuarii]QIZ71833.1 hypothetical protein HCG48_15620 [Oxynema aestuarii AP17]
MLFSGAIAEFSRQCCTIKPYNLRNGTRAFGAASSLGEAIAPRETQTSIAKRRSQNA